MNLSPNSPIIHQACPSSIAVDITAATLKHVGKYKTGKR